MRVLIVDDNPDAAVSLDELLRIKGHHTTIARSGNEAVRLWDEHGWDLVFLDLKMPGMDGYTTAQNILSLNPNARIVVVTGNSVHEDLERVRSLGIAGLLRKPFRIEELLSYL